MKPCISYETLTLYIATLTKNELLPKFYNYTRLHENKN
jgi:hypothetical protein